MPGLSLTPGGGGEDLGEILDRLDALESSSGGGGETGLEDANTPVAAIGYSGPLGSPWTQMGNLGTYTGNAFREAPGPGGVGQYGAGMHEDYPGGLFQGSMLVMLRGVTSEMSDFSFQVRATWSTRTPRNAGTTPVTAWEYKQPFRVDTAMRSLLVARSQETEIPNIEGAYLASGWKSAFTTEPSVIRLPSFSDFQAWADEIPGVSVPSDVEVGIYFYLRRVMTAE